MNVLVAVLAFIVAVEYAAIAIDIVPRLARMARIDRRTMIAARWGATAFFVGCAITHTMIGLQTLFPSLRGGMDMDMAADGGDLALLLQMVLPHIAQIVGGAIFIAISRTKLEVNITSKQEATQVRELDRQFRSALDLAPVGIALFAPSGQLSTASYANPAYLNIFGYDASGPVPAEADTLALVHPADRASVLTSTSHIGAGKPVDLEYRIVRPDGAIRWVHTRRNPLTDLDGTTTRVTSVLEDVTDRVNAHAALIAGERRFAQLADSVTLGINLRQLRPPKFLWGNRAYAQIVGADVVQDPNSTKDPALVLLHPGDRERVMNGYWPRSQAGEVAESEHRVLRPDGEIRWVHITSNPVLDDDGTINRVAGTVEDITARKSGEAAQAARLLAERANMAKTELLSRTSHELRTPLNAVLGFAQLLELDPLTAPQTESVHHILVAGRHLVTLIDDVLDISQIDSARLDVVLEPVDLLPFLTQVVGLMEPAATAANIELLHESHPADIDGNFVSADRRRLQQVLLNLLANAIKYNTPGGSVHVGARTGEGKLLIDVTDTGIGIAAEDLPRLFTPFDRLGQERSDIQGTGIGLALAHRLVKAMSGDLYVTSTEGTGSTFTVALPLAAPPPKVPAPKSEKMVQPALTAAMSSLLYIEDNPENAELMARIVQRRPTWVLTVAGDGANGLDVVRSISPSLIMLDLHLPDMHGIEVLARLRADPATANIPVIVLSADANPSEITRLERAGAAGYRTKPLQISEILHDLDCYAATSPALEPTNR